MQWACSDEPQEQEQARILVGVCTQAAWHTEEGSADGFAGV